MKLARFLCLTVTNCFHTERIDFTLKWIFRFPSQTIPKCQPSFYKFPIGQGYIFTLTSKIEDQIQSSLL